MTRSLARIRNLTLLVLLLGMAAIAFAAFQLAFNRAQSAGQDAAMLGRGIAEAITAVIQQQRALVRNVAHQADVASALARGTPADWEEKEKEIMTIMPNTLATHLLLLDASGATLSSGELDSACANYVRHAVASEQQSVPEFHRSRDARAHYDLIEPVRDEADRPLGYVLASFTLDPLVRILARSLPEGAHVELRQRATGGSAHVGKLVANAGISQSADPAFRKDLSIAGTAWTLAYSPPRSASSILTEKRPYFLALILAAMLGVTAAITMLFKRAVKSVRHDITSLLRMFEDMRDGNMRVDYPMMLAEFGKAFAHVRSSGKQLVQEKKKLQDMGLIDHLSRLSNRRHFEMRLKELFELSRAHGPSSLLIIDMDRFKSVNDQYGHDAGDALIVAFASALRKAVRQTDFLARLGGDEFCVIYTYAPLEEAVNFAERLRRQLPHEVTLTKGVLHSLRWTGGISAIADADTKFDDVLWRADQALIQAKEAGRNVTHMYHPVHGLEATPPIAS